MSLPIPFCHAALFVGLAISADNWFARVGFALLVILWLIAIRNLRAQAARGSCAFCGLRGAEVQAERSVMDSDGNRWTLCCAHAHGNELANEAHAELFGERVLAE
jgi:membrane protein implicated in regulation of membrane protease activity